MKFILKIYDYFVNNTKLLWITLLIFIIFFVLGLLNLKYSEDIGDFLPLGTSEQESLSVYQNISGANRIYILFNNPNDADYTINAIDCFLNKVQEKDSLNWCKDLTAQFNIEQIQEVMNFIYDNIPYFLTSKDYTRIDSLLSQPNYISSQLKRNKEMLMFPSSGMMLNSIMRDPLSLYSPILDALQNSNQQMNFEMYEGYIFTPDMTRAIAMMSSPFGNSETEYNSRILLLLHESIDYMEEQFPDVKVNIVGGPEIAVGNASRIKKDSIFAISLSIILIVILAIYTIGSFRNVLLIFLSIGWGWLFALAGMSFFSSQVSIIVIGISSVMLGIAVNYPLHLIVHITHVPNKRIAIKEIITPLIIGNITTVGAFITLIPLQSVALHDLGLFASFLLIGTIIFVLIYLPHFLKEKNLKSKESRILNIIASFSPEKYTYLVIIVCIITIILSFYSFKTDFDSNIANMNYMTKDQKEHMQYFQNLFSKQENQTTQMLYVLSSANTYDDALNDNIKIIHTIDSLIQIGLIEDYKSVYPFLSSKQEQEERINAWNDFTSKYCNILTDSLEFNATQIGFSSNAFHKFITSIKGEENILLPQDIEYFSPLTKSIFAQNITQLDDNKLCYIVNILNVNPDNLEDVKSYFSKCFDVISMNNALSSNLSENFNYIGWACSVIVFLFLWFFFGSIELAIISFIPMAISWIWILGIMTLLGIKFNIVNIILATFIFGQGDDYTIFMTEGCQYEYKYQRSILKSYKSSIIQSALIMFVGIGTLIVSKHPAMHSLAQVTIIGMVCVVFMSYMIPPLLFSWLTMKKGIIRTHPITLKTILFGYPNKYIDQVKGRYIYKGKEIEREVNRNLKNNYSKLINLNIENQSDFTMFDEGYGESALLLALKHPEKKILVKIDDKYKLQIAKVAVENFVDNIEFI